MKEVKIVPYNENWPKEFLIESQRVMEVLGNNCIEIHHIGSTAVPGLAAKPVIDILPVVQDINIVDKYNEAMERLGYTPRGEDGIPMRRYFRKGITVRTHHIHIFEEGNPQVMRHIKFRDWMRNHPEDMKAYESLKKKLAIQFSNDRHAYTEGKNEFIAMIDKKAVQAS